MTQARYPIDSESAIRHVLAVSRRAFVEPNPACSQDCEQGRECECCTPVPETLPTKALPRTTPLTAGLYVPAPWRVRAGADDHKRVPSRTGFSATK